MELNQIDLQFLIWIDENDSSVITHSQETNIVDLYGYSKSEKFTLFSQDLHWGILGFTY